MHWKLILIAQLHPREYFNRFVLKWKRDSSTCQVLCCVYSSATSASHRSHRHLELNGLSCSRFFPLMNLYIIWYRSGMVRRMLRNKTRFVWSFIEFSQSSCRKVETVFLLARLFSVLVFLLLTSCCAYRTFSLPVSFFGLSFSLCGIRMGTFNAQFSSISGRCSTERL